MVTVHILAVRLMLVPRIFAVFCVAEYAVIKSFLKKLFFKNDLETAHLQASIVVNLPLLSYSAGG